MRKIVTILVCLVMLFSVPAFGSELTDSVTHVDFNIIDMNADAFMAAYDGRISFDGYIDYYDTETITIDNNFTAQDVFIIYPGDYEDKYEHSFDFIIRNMIENPTCSYDRWTLEAGRNVSVTATIVGFDGDDLKRIELSDATISLRPTDLASSEQDQQNIESTIQQPNGNSDLIYEEGKGIQAGSYYFACDSTIDGYCVVATFADKASYERFSADYSVSRGFDENSSFYKIIHKDESCYVKIDNGMVLIVKYGTGTLHELDSSKYRTIQSGDASNEVKTLQQRLIDLYYLSGTTDGKFGKNTKAAIEKFQVTHGISVTGIADAETQAMLFSDNATQASLSVSCSSMVVGSQATTVWYVDGQEFKLTGNKTKTIKTIWGTYKFDAFGNYEKIEN